jgi:hypothetical protein
VEEEVEPKKEEICSDKESSQENDVQGCFFDDGLKTRRKKPKEVFLAKVNLEMLKKELGFSTVEEIGTFVNLANPKNAYNWAKEKDDHGTRPSWNAIVRMLRRGATTKTLFGVDSPEVSSEPQKIVLTDDLIAEMMTRAGEMLKKKK